MINIIIFKEAITIEIFEEIKEIKDNSPVEEKIIVEWII